MTAIYSNGGNRWNILGFNFTKRDALSSLYKIFMHSTHFIYTGYLYYFESVLINHYRGPQYYYRRTPQLN